MVTLNPASDLSCHFQPRKKSIDLLYKDYIEYAASYTTGRNRFFLIIQDKIPENIDLDHDLITRFLLNKGLFEGNFINVQSCVI